MAEPFPPSSASRASRGRFSHAFRAPTFRAPVVQRGFTLSEVLIVLGIIALLIALAVPTIVKVRAAQRSTACAATLRQIASALQVYAQENRMRFPDPGLSNLSWEQMLVAYHKAPFACPSDQEVFPTLGSSYDWRDTGDPLTTLAGRSIAAIARTDAVMAFEALPGWHGTSRINIARVDGSVSLLQEDECFQDLARPVLAGSFGISKTTTAAPPTQRP